MVSLASGAMTRIAVVQDLQIQGVIRSVTHRPKERISIVGIDVIVDGNDEFSARSEQRRRAVKRSPHFGGRGFSVDDHGDDFS